MCDEGSDKEREVGSTAVLSLHFARRPASVPIIPTTSEAVVPAAVTISAAQSKLWLCEYGRDVTMCWRGGINGVRTRAPEALPV